jgi:hypothetical protein
MDPKYQKILFITIIVLLVAIIAWLFVQQRSLNRLNSACSSGFANSGGQSPALGQKLSDSLVEDIKNDLLQNTRELIGKVTKVDGQSITIEAEVVDLGKIAEAESADYDKLPKITKTFIVQTDSKTDFPGLKLGQIKAGTLVRVVAVDSIYQSDKLLAEQFIAPYVTSFEKMGFITVKLESIDSGGVLKAKGASKDDQNEYTIRTTENTKFVKMESVNNEGVLSDIKLSDIKAGDFLTISAPEKDMQGKTDITAKVITLTVIPTQKP